MEHHNIHHDNVGMGLLSIVLSAGTYLLTKEITGEAIHLGSVLVGAVAVFLLQKGMNFLWDKYVKKNGSNK